MRWPEINLAPIKYAKIHKDFGGPIDRISFREISLFGRPAFEAFAYLDETVAGPGEKTSVLYGNPDGSGTAHSQAAAVYSAISEALERWAWRSTSAGNDPEQYGYNLDSSTNGFAAFPGLGTGGARRRALAEAVERWSVAAWWENQLSHTEINSTLLPPNTLGFHLEPIKEGIVTVILKANQPRFTAYSFASASSLAGAIEKALIELDRNQRTIPIFLDSTEELQLKSLIEKRLVYFASPAGTQRFNDRAAISSAKKSPIPNLKLDKRVEGPWSAYTYVWRCLFDGTKLNETQDIDYFLF